MTNRPDWMTVRPSGTADLLSEVLRGVRLTGALYYRVSTSCLWPPIRVPIGAALWTLSGAALAMWSPTTW